MLIAHTVTKDGHARQSGSYSYNNIYIAVTKL